ncbi:MAG: RICIN domain-containing protein [Scytonema hyalinum WJT4-NPBG1]|jgi:hypothetical protein|nr:RICIN domain-containing protein [Scytonema hyalinum WJT4-NPBG1]
MKLKQKNWRLFLSTLTVMGVTCGISTFLALVSPQASACSGFFGQFDPTCDRRPQPRRIESSDLFYPTPPAKGFILNSLSGKCIDVAGAPGNTNGARLQLWNCEASGRNADNGSTTDQKWEFTRGFIRNTLSGKCIDVAGAPGNTNGAPLQLWDCEWSGRNPDNGSETDQIWTLTRDGFILNVASGKCIDVAGAPGNRNGAPLQLWNCETSGRNTDNGSETDQKWQL